MPHFVRCIEGHVFDATTSGICPTCGAAVETVTVAAIDEPASPKIAPKAAGITGSAGHMPFLAAIAALTFAGGAGTLIYALHRSGAQPAAPVTANASVTNGNALGKSASSTGSAPPSPAITPRAPIPAPATANQAFSAPLPQATPAAPNEQQPAPAATSISDTLRTTLDAVHMFVIDVPNHYSEALSIAEELIKRGNPMGMLAKAEITTDGLAGEEDPTLARALLKDAVSLGEPLSLGKLGYFFEQGIGGARDINIANQLYVLAARAGGAEENITRLHLEGDVGMTAPEAFRTLSADNANPQAVREAVGALIRLHGITPATCMEAFLMPLAEARGWNLTNRIAGANVSRDQANASRLKALQYGAVQIDPWCEWGLGQLASTGFPNYSKNLVEADVFYRLAAMKMLQADAGQLKSELAAVERQMTPAEKGRADALFHGVVPASMAP